MKKAMAFALTAVLALGVLGLVGCGSQGGTQSQDGKPVLTGTMRGNPPVWPWTSCGTSRIATATTS